jgi:hypothetical protein
MPNYTALRNAAVIVNMKVAALVVVVFICGLASGLILLQYSLRNAATDTSQEALDLFGQHFWGGNNWTESAIVVVNIGEKDVTLTKIVILGTEINWSRVYYWKTASGPVSSELNSTSGELSGASFSIVVDGTERDFHQASNELALQVHWTIVLYVRNPGDVSPEDVPQKVTIAVFTEDKMYYREVDSEVTFIFTNTEQITFTGYSWGSPGTTTVPYMLITIKNTGASDLSVSEVRVDGVTANHNGTFPYALAKGYSVALNITRTGNYARGTQYSFMVITAKGNQFGPYTQTAP